MLFKYDCLDEYILLPSYYKVFRLNLIQAILQTLNTISFVLALGLNSFSIQKMITPFSDDKLSRLSSEYRFQHNPSWFIGTACTTMMIHTKL